MHPTQYHQRHAAAHFLQQRGFHITKRQLEKLACAGGGPSFRKFGRRALYAEDDLIAWATSRLTALQCSTSEARNDR